MPLKVHIPEENLEGFSAEARDHLKTVVHAYAFELIEEANRIEAGRDSTKGPPEVTRAMVNDAKDLLRRGLGTRKKSLLMILCRVLAAVLSLAVGIMYDATKLQDRGYMFWFILLVAFTILTVTISTIKE